METVVISLGGSLIVPDQIDIEYLKKFRQLALNYIKKNNRLIIVCGGGKTCRRYQAAAKTLVNSSNLDNDWIGIMATRLNAEFIRVLFKNYAYEKVIYNPNQKITTKKRIVIAAGYLPGCSTDADTVILAHTFQARLLVNTTDVDYIYEKDPRKYPQAKKFEYLSWDDYRKVIGGKFVAGMHAPFDPIASKLARKYRMKVAIVNGKNLENLNNLLQGKKFQGTILS